MAVHPNPKKVLVIGGGDGGVAQVLTLYPELEQIDIVEPDEMLVEVCREYFPDFAAGLDDPRVTIYYQNGLRFLRNCEDDYDIIINDATDPFGHTEGLFTKEFYGNSYRALKEDGIMIYQHGSPFFDEDESACPKYAPQGQSSLSNQSGLSGAHPNQSSWLLAIWICIEKIPPCQRF